MAYDIDSWADKGDWSTVCDVGAKLVARTELSLCYGCVRVMTHNAHRWLPEMGAVCFDFCVSSALLAAFRWSMRQS
jgi:hypothetical protein